eukprot:scaffold21620_cov65-Phaeocystis_antarctica.AAC.4
MVLACATAQIFDVSEAVVGVLNAPKVPEHGHAHAKRQVVVDAATTVSLGHCRRHNHACLPVHVRPQAHNPVELDRLLRLEGRDHGAALLHVAELLQEGRAAVVLALAHVAMQPGRSPQTAAWPGGAPNGHAPAARRRSEWRASRAAGARPLARCALFPQNSATRRLGRRPQAAVAALVARWRAYDRVLCGGVTSCSLPRQNASCDGSELVCANAARD